MSDLGGQRAWRAVHVCRAVPAPSGGGPRGGRGAQPVSLYFSCHCIGLSDTEGMKGTCACAGLFLCRAAVGLGEGVAPSLSPCTQAVIALDSGTQRG